MVNLKEKAKNLMYGYFDTLGLDGDDLAMAVDSSEIKIIRGNWGRMRTQYTRPFINCRANTTF